VCSHCHILLCLECFSHGIETATHRRAHPCAVLDSGPPYLFSSDWTSHEELLLLDGLSRHGFGNWVSVSSLVQTKSASECELHYSLTYVESPASPRPAPGRRSPPPPIDDARAADSPPRPEREYHDDAESLLADLAITEADTPEALAAKLGALECYAGQVAARSVRAALADGAGQSPAVTAVGREVDAAVDPLFPVLGAARGREIAGLLKEEAALALQIRIREYWRQNGVEEVAEGVLFMRLQSLLERDALPAENVAEWNRRIAEFEAGGAMPNGREEEICARYGMSHACYFAVKDLLLREAMARGGITRQQAVAYDPDRAEVVGAIYDYMRGAGWIDG
jgi:hypothetical protein